jgi:hypothetical protein
VTQEQVVAELALHLEDLLGERGLRDAEPFGGAGEVLLVGDLDDVAELPDLQRHHPSL